MFTEDLTPFFNTSDFAETITFESASVTALVGISNIENDTEYQNVLSETKDLIVKSSEVGTVVVGQDVTVGTDVWRVVGYENLLNGVLRLTINRFIS